MPMEKFRVVSSAKMAPPTTKKVWTGPGMNTAADTLRGWLATSLTGSTPAAMVLITAYSTTMAPVETMMTKGMSLVGFLA